LLIQAISDKPLPLESAQYHALPAMLSMMIKQALARSHTAAALKDRLAGISTASGRRFTGFKSNSRILLISRYVEPFQNLALLYCEC
jgi:hypothetical protein